MGKLLRILAIVLLSLTAAMTLLGGIGTTCVAFAAEKFGPRMAALIPVKPIFQVLVVISIAAAIYGIVATIKLAKGSAKAYNQVMIFLIVGLIASAVQFYYSLTLRGSTAPNNVRLYLTAFTLVMIGLLRLPGIWARAGFERSGNTSGMPGAASGAALILCGFVVITTPLWGAATHMIDGYNTVNELLLPLLISGAGMIFLGGVKVARLGWRTQQRATVSRVDSPQTANAPAND